MLRRLEPTHSYRSLSKGFWSNTLPLARRSVIYGHNGSGKSSFASLLLEIASDDASTEVLWEDEHGQSHTVRVGQGAPSSAIAVFTKEWVRRNLSQFLDGATASPIVTLGEEAIEAKEQEEELSKQVENLRAKAKESDRKRQEQQAKAKKLATAAQNAIADQLREFDYQRFTKNRFSLPVIEGKLRDYKGEFPDENRHAEALKRLGEGAAVRVGTITEPPKVISATLDRLGPLLSETPTRVALEMLATDNGRQTWVEHGLKLHEQLDVCLFCSNPLTDERREELAKHFDQSWLIIRERAHSLLQSIQQARGSLSDWFSNLPDPLEVSSELRDAFVTHLHMVKDAVAVRLKVLEDIESALHAKADDPSITLPEPDWAALNENYTVAPLQQAVEEHNKQADEHLLVAEARYETVLDHIVGSRSDAFRSLEEQTRTAQAEAKAANDGADLAQRTLLALRQQKFSNSQMAKTLTTDLARVYGKDHLSVAVTDDGKSYACRRGDDPATHLSDGERTTLSLLYFLRKLEDETVSGDKSARIVVIDDPSSSLDREALFATHQWLVDTLNGFGQFIVLTHDFGLLRLFLKSQKNAWDNSRKKIREGNADEERFPKASFLEMYASNDNGGRRTKIAPLPPMLSKHTTEYAYLFSKVMSGVADGTDHDQLFLLPNAARRVLEVFTSYKAPHLGNFDQRLGDLMGNPVSNPYRDVYDFCNRYSHGEGNESVDVLDGRVVHGQIRRCMEFMKSADHEHFERLCKATDIDPAIIS
ncbi:AAA family ATPase [Arthrobacter sp. M2012083]|uniref:AAA family ATPase n=1 Tax=Arthrobacter sp. M2012083 TaxID=1197706 RepID=UPI000365D692|nr:AAA family ATPase [Arthrobacter sp. M2012083]